MLQNVLDGGSLICLKNSRGYQKCNCKTDPPTDEKHRRNTSDDNNDPDDVQNATAY